MTQANQLQQKSVVFTWCLPVISCLGATALFLGTATLFTARKEHIVRALPHLTTPSTDWLLFTVGIVLLLASSVIWYVTIRRNRMDRRAWGRDNEAVKEPQTRKSTTLEPARSKVVAAILNLVLLGFGLPAFAAVTFLINPSSKMTLALFFLFLSGFIVITTAIDSLSCRVQIFDGEIHLWSWSRAKSFPAVEIRSAKYSRYRGTTSLTVLGDRSWFTVSSNSFDPDQLDDIRKFCDQAANLYPKWSS